MLCIFSSFWCNKAMGFYCSSVRPSFWLVQWEPVFIVPAVNQMWKMWIFCLTSKANVIESLNCCDSTQAIQEKWLCCSLILLKWCIPHLWTFSSHVFVFTCYGCPCIIVIKPKMFAVIQRCCPLFPPTAVAWTKTVQSCVALLCIVAVLYCNILYIAHNKYTLLLNMLYFRHIFPEQVGPVCVNTSYF